MENYNKEMEKNLLEMAKQKEESDKQLLRLEILTGSICVAILLAAAIVAAYVQIEEIWRVVIVLGGLVPLLVALPFLIRIEQTAGYYECKHCGHKHVPTFKEVILAMHMGRTRYMRCPKCGQKSWQKKVISKE